jgi:hypothetical protein
MVDAKILPVAAEAETGRAVDTVRTIAAKKRPTSTEEVALRGMRK